MKHTRFPKPSLHDTMKIAILRPVTLVILLIGFIAILINFPFTTERVTAASSSAMPIPTPPNRVAIDALVQSLKDTLPDLVDEDSLNLLTEKWDNERERLSGRTKSQIIGSLFGYLKGIITDVETQNAIWASWGELRAQAKTEESTQSAQKSGYVNGRYVLSDESRRNKGDGNLEAFLLDYGRAKVWANPDTRQYKGQSYSIYVATEPADPAARDKVAGINNAVKTVVDNGFVLPPGLRFYCSSVDSTFTQAFERGTNWAPIAYIILGPSSTENSAAPALSVSAAGFNGFETRTITVIHEIGHILHERQLGDGFWQPLVSADPNVSVKVSKYAAKGNFKEFVAEVFAGLMIGKRWPNDVLAEYHKFRGPVPATF